MSSVTDASRSVRISGLAQIWVSISIGAQWSKLRAQRGIIYPRSIGRSNVQLRKSDLIERLSRRTGGYAAARRSRRSARNGDSRLDNTAAMTMTKIAMALLLRLAAARRNDK